MGEEATPKVKFGLPAEEGSDPDRSGVKVVEIQTLLGFLDAHAPTAAQRFHS